MSKKIAAMFTLTPCFQKYMEVRGTHSELENQLRRWLHQIKKCARHTDGFKKDVPCYMKDADKWQQVRALQDVDDSFAFLFKLPGCFKDHKDALVQV